MHPTNASTLIRTSHFTSCCQMSVFNLSA
ncbi:unnamed protein product [Oikopleura dioica]|uniref:Uncharacterized protein n=1 Tax=Oikopleura dioica TaxID=34765 RepID=E4Z1C2_OIKDI|nr:unnamed protein product [Oikopleura dioica]